MTQRIGVGLSYRAELHEAIARHRHLFDLFEIMTESLYQGEQMWRRLNSLSDIPTVCHGVEMSLGTADGLDAVYLEKMVEVVARLGPLWASDHIALTRVDGVQLGHLSPVHGTDEMVEIVVRNIRAAQTALGLRTPLLIENIAYLFAIPGGMTEAEFITKIVRACGCGILLDLNNLYANAVNHRYDPQAFLDNIPLDNVVQVHLAGGEQREDLFIDTHAHTVNARVWELLDMVCERSAVRAVILERDENLDHPLELFEEVARARSVWNARIGLRRSA